MASKVRKWVVIGGFQSSLFDNVSFFQGPLVIIIIIVIDGSIKQNPIVGY